VKASTIERLAREHLLPVLPGFAVGRSLVYRRPLGHFLCAISFGTSSFAATRIFAEALVHPLYVPYEEIASTFGFRLGDDFWDLDEDPDATFAALAETARRDALPFFEELGDLDRFAELVPKWAADEPKKLKSLQSLDDPVVLEALGYTQLLRGRKEEGVRLLERAVESEREEGEYGNDDLIENVQKVLDTVDDLGLEAGQAVLEEWRAATIDALDLEE